ncbi:MAG: endopeptidase La [Thermoanaerobaculia bacterium]|nr:endopeptidase La [Thermoanaerobaculia bacterium]
MSPTKSDDLRPPEGIPEGLDRVPVIPLSSAVLFPGSVLSLQVATSKSLEALRSLAEGETLVGAFVQSRGDNDAPRPGDLCRTGVLATVVQKLAIAPGRVQLFLQGRARIRADEFIQAGPLLEARVWLAPRVEPPDAETATRLVEKAGYLFEKLVESDARYGSELVGVIRSNLASGAEIVADLLSTSIHANVEEKQSLLEALDPLERLEKVIRLMQKDLSRAVIDRDVERQTQLSINRRERERYLREQLRVIQDELGDTPLENEVDSYVERIDKLPLEDDQRLQLRREIQRLSLLSPGSSDYAVIRGHLDTVLQMPWTESTEDQLDVERAAQLLETNHHGLREVKDRVLEFLSVLKLKGDLKGPILCFVGPPGVGKTSLGKSIAGALGRKFVRLSVGGVTDESEIRGHRKTYVGAMPGKLVHSYIQVGTHNPLVMIDEIDKIGKDFRGDPASALLEVLDPQQNSSFTDRYLEVPFDLSRTLFITTANVLDDIPPALRDRLEVIRLAGYDETEKLQIAKRHLMPAILADHGLTPAYLEIDDEAMSSIIRDYTAEAGVRELTRRIASIVRKVARRIVTEGLVSESVTKANLASYLGMATFEHEFAGRAPEIGVATGLAWTSVGGEIMFIEATRMKGSGKTTVTGHLGEVMRESVQAAYSYVRSRAGELGIDETVFTGHDIHIHFPAGAIQKDGPSAGVAIATAIASVMAGRPIRHDVAMTGEITLRGKVLSIGGVKEKLIAASRAHIRRVVVPMGNRKDLTELHGEVRRGLDIVFAERVEDAWCEALMPAAEAGSGRVKPRRAGANANTAEERRASR